MRTVPVPLGPAEIVERIGVLWGERSKSLVTVTYDAGVDTIMLAPEPEIGGYVEVMFWNCRAPASLYEC